MKSVEALGKSLANNQYKRIAVLAGAGISVNAGIPDFRSKSGLYSTLKDPSLMFNLSHFKKDPTLFYSQAKHLIPPSPFPTLSHYFIKILELKNLLSICYTQNIDNLERQAGIQNLVQAHGNMLSSHCTVCLAPGENSQVLSHMRSGQPLYCSCGGPVKPDVVFFGESLSESFHSKLDFIRIADLMIVIGTSLQVYPFAGLVECAGKIQRVVINKEKVESFEEVGFEFEDGRDSLFVGDCDEVCLTIIKSAGWEGVLKELQEKRLQD